MILYFSATGNCRYVAEQIAEATDETAVSIEKASSQITISENEILGLVVPAYAWELPLIVREYLEGLNLIVHENTYSFIVVTYGTTPGAAGADAAHMLKIKGISVSAKYSIQMPDTWTPMFDLSDDNIVNAKLSKADEELSQVISNIKRRKTGNMMHRSVPYAARYITDIWYNSMRQTKYFHVEDSCIGCSICEKDCPAHVIEIRKGKPVWTQDRCIMCLRCLHHCPKFAIQYGSNTRKHGQYRHPGK